MEFTIADYIIIGVILFSVLISLVRGFVKEFLSLVVWIVAFWVAITFSHEFSLYFKPYIATPSVQLAAAFLVLLVGVLIVGGIFNYFITRFVEMTGLSGTDRMIGIIFGFARGVLLVAVLLLVGRSTPLAQDPWWKTSVLIPHFAPLEIWIRSLLPESVSKHFNTPS